jgi:hypothetical protein
VWKGVKRKGKVGEEREIGLMSMIAGCKITIL